MARNKVDEKTSTVVARCGLAGRWEGVQVTLKGIPDAALKDPERLNYLIADAFLHHLRQFVQINPQIGLTSEQEEEVPDPEVA